MKPHWSLVTLYLSLAILVGMCSYFVWGTTRLESGLESRAETVLTHLDSTLSQTDAVVAETGTAVVGIQKSVSGVASGINQSIRIVNHPCVPGPCGTLSDVAKTLNTVRGTFGEIETAANHEDRNLSTLDKQEDALFQDTHVALANIVPLQNEIDKAAYDLDALVSSPDVSGVARNLNTVTYNLGQTTGDFQNKFHAFLFPPPCHGFKCDVVKAFTVIKVGSSLMEPAYWGTQLFQAIH
jgi:hypothetical protein